MWQGDLFRDLLLGISDRTAQVTPAYAELDRDIALIAFVINIRCASVECYVRKIAQPDIRVGAVPSATDSRHAHLNVAHFLQIVAKLRRDPHDQTELLVILEDGGGLRAAQRGLYHGVYVARIQPIACGLGAVNLNIQIGLAEYAENAQVGHTRYTVHHLQYGGGDVFQLGEVRPYDLHRIRTFDAGQAFLNIVLNVLREIECNAGEFVGKFFLQLLNQFVLGQARRPFGHGL